MPFPPARGSLARAALAALSLSIAACAGGVQPSPWTEPAAEPRAQVEGEKSLGRLEGTWVPVAVERDGQAVPVGEWPHLRWKFAEGAAVVTSAGVSGGPPATRQWRAYVDRREEPWFLDLEDAEHRALGFAAVYKFDGDSLVVCWNEGRLRPRSFDTRGTGATRVTFARE